MKIENCMTNSVELISPNATIQEAAAKMREFECGVIPVAENDKLVGLITDRDIVVRTVAMGLDPNRSRVKEGMSYEVFYCYSDQDISDVAKMMSDMEVSRMPVLNREKRLVGIISTSDISKYSAKIAKNTLADMARIH